MQPRQTPTPFKGWQCDNCLTTDIRVFSGAEREQKETDCFCNECRDEQYIVSAWWTDKSAWWTDKKES